LTGAGADARIYGQLARGTGHAEALRRAKLRLLRQSRFGHSYYWAALSPPVTGPLSPPARYASRRQGDALEDSCVVLQMGCSGAHRVLGLSRTWCTMANGQASSAERRGCVTRQASEYSLQPRQVS